MPDVSTHPFSLLAEPWLPVRRASGAHSWIRPAEITAGLADDPIVALTWPRPDLRVACLELLIGLLATACPPDPDDSDDWVARWHKPPTPDQLDAAFAPLAPAFRLDGDGPRFCQDLEQLDAEPSSVDRLFIDAPSDEEVNSNEDLCIKRSRYSRLSRPAAAIALFAFQTFAKKGGRGYMTSVRGSGPLTSLVVPGTLQESLTVPIWHQLWANVVDGRRPKEADLPLVFPWLAETRKGGKGGCETFLNGVDGHPLQAYWGMPRRVRVDFALRNVPARCDLTGREDCAVTTSFRQKHGGVQYRSSAQNHPLSPTATIFSSKTKSLDVTSQRASIATADFRAWHELLREQEKQSAPARVVAEFVKQERFGSLSPETKSGSRIFLAGFDINTKNNKARGFLETEMPMVLTQNSGVHGQLVSYGRKLSLAADNAAQLLVSVVRTALDDPDASASPLDAVRAAFFEATAPGFWSRLNAARDALDADPEHDLDPSLEAWLPDLRAIALRLFGQAAPLNPLAPAAAGRMERGVWHPPKLVEARRRLSVALAGYGREGAVLLAALGLPAREPKAKRGRKAA